MAKPAATDKPHKPKVPPWTTEHFKSFVVGIETLGQMVRISERGISVLRGMPKIVKVLASVDGEPTNEESRKRLEMAERDATRAQSEVDTDFPLLHGLAVVALWSALEHFTKGLVTSWLLHRKDSLSAPSIQRLKVKLGDYLQLSRAEQAHYLVELLEQELSSPLKKGASRFESVLEPFSLSGALPDGIAKTLFELQQVRNVIAHRNGLADKRLRSNCPWLKCKLNHSVRVTGKMLSSYRNAALEYALTVFYRVGDVYGQDLRPEAPNKSPERTREG